jgi:hypothetical protein
MSTSLMYSFAQHPAVANNVMDEPFYAYYLHQTGVQRPYTDLVMKSQSIEPRQIIESIYRRHNTVVNNQVRFIKHIAKQIVGLSASEMRQLLTGTLPTETCKVRHLILVRDPMAVLKSFHAVLGREGATLAETSLTDLCWLYAEIERLTGRPPAIIDSYWLQHYPEATLQLACQSIDLPWSPSMLSWPAGTKPYDGVWAPW